MARKVSNLIFVVDHVDEAVEAALSETAYFILLLVRLLAPVDTGWLRDSYKSEKVSPTHIMIGTMVKYSIWVEFGSSKNGKAQPHLTPAFALGTQLFKESVAHHINELLQRANF